MKKQISLVLMSVFAAGSVFSSAPSLAATAPTTAKEAQQNTAIARPAGRVLYSGAKSEIDATDKDSAFIKIRSLSANPKKLKVTIEKTGGLKYTYDLDNTGKTDIYSLQQGDGEYTVKVLENIADTRYAVLQTQVLKIKYTTEFDPFLIPIKLINYTDSSSVVKKAKELTKNCVTDIEKLNSIYKFIVDNITYDDALANNIVKGTVTSYTPVVDNVLGSKKGICYDYSALLASMLRSVGIPAKMIMGYVAPNNAYHAWNEVYIKGVGWIKVNGQIYFDGKKYSRMDSTFAASDKKGKNSDFIGNGTNYSTKWTY